MIIMSKQTIFRFIIPIFILSSVFSGLTLNFASFFNSSIIDSKGSWFISVLRFADLLAISFILFYVILLITIAIVEKINKPFLIIGIIFTGFTYIYAGITWNWVFYFIMFIMSSIGIAFITPVILKYITRALPSDKRKNNYLIYTLLTIIGWIVCFFILFNIIGVHFWRFLYIISGVIAVFSSLFIIYFEGPSEIK